MKKFIYVQGTRGGEEKHPTLFEKVYDFIDKYGRELSVYKYFGEVPKFKSSFS